MGNEVIANGDVSAEIRSRMIVDGRVDAASLRETIEHLYSELEDAPDMGRVRNALAIALMELERTNKQRTVIISHDLGRSNYFPWTAARR